MKSLIIEIRMYLAEILLSWAFSISPTDKNQGLALKKSIIEYFESCTIANKYKKSR